MQQQVAVYLETKVRRMIHIHCPLCGVDFASRDKTNGVRNVKDSLIGHLRSMCKVTDRSF